MPAALRDEISGKLMIGYGSGDFLVVYPEAMMNRFYDEYSSVKITDYEKINEVREFFGSMKPFNGDQQGRYQIPLDMRGEVGLKDDIVIIGALAWLEIWSKKAYESRKDDGVRLSRIDSK